MMVFALLLCSCGSSPSPDAVPSSKPAPSVSNYAGDTTVVEALDYTKGVHHAELVFEGYESQPLELEIFSDSAPVTSLTFCRLVDSGFYDDQPVLWILNEMYLRIGSTEQQDDFLITGEYAESGVKNANPLKRGYIAMNRSLDGQQSDASSLIVFMSDLSFLDGKYAAFAKITENYSVIEEIASRTTASDFDIKIVVDDTGRIIDEMKYPRISSIKIID